MDQADKKLSRRSFLKGAGALAAAVGAASLMAGCETGSTSDAASSTTVLQPGASRTLPLAQQYPAVQFTPHMPPDSKLLLFFSPHEARTVEALTARIMPGTPDDPGAREAGVATYIDGMLAAQEFAQPTYRQGPFAQVAGGQTKPQLPDQATFSSSSSQGAQTQQGGQQGQSGQQSQGGQGGQQGYQFVDVPADLITRYGYQSILTPRDVYRMGIEAVDRYANSTFGKDFMDLTAAQQDSVVGDLFDDKASGFGRELSAKHFAGVLMQHTAEGMFSDPVYGGNRNMVGWQILGYPGVQRAYLPEELRTEGINSTRKPQGIMQLHPTSPGQYVNDQVILPLSGSQPDYNQPPAPPSEKEGNK